MTTENETQKTVLVVEDEETLRKVLIDELKEAHYLIEEAFDGEDGLEKALRIHPDIILLDLLMPKMDGMSLLKKLREDPWGKGVKVIILTNLNDVEKISDALADGVTDYIVKSSMRIEDISEKVRAVLSK